MGCLAVLALPFAATCFFVGERVAGLVVGAVAVALAVAAILAFYVSYHRFSAPIRDRVRRDIANASVEVLSITDAVAFNIPAAHASVDPAFAIELDDGRTLLLLGQWLSEPSTFGADAKDLPEADDGDAFANALPPPCSFPTRAFTLHRFPISGEVVRVELVGDYVAPEDIDLDLRRVNDMPSRILECTLADLPGAVARLAAGPSDGQ